MLKNLLNHWKTLYNGRFGFVFDVALAITITYLFHRLWWRFDEYFKPFLPFRVAMDWFKIQVFENSLWINRNIIGLQIQVRDPLTYVYSNGSSMFIHDDCSGMKQFYQVIVLFLLTPGPWRHKLWYIPMGIVVMHLANVFRIVVLSVVSAWQPDYWRFTHDWVLRPFFYFLIFLLWVLWMEKIRRKSAGR